MGMKNANVWFEVNDHGERIHLEVSDWQRHKFNLSDSWDAECAASACAEYYHSHCDGWESAWPLTFDLALSEDGPVMHRFEIYREYEPTFSARKVAQPDPTP